jgi:geranylgeranyl diphosphate synthase, type I
VEFDRLTEFRAPLERRLRASFQSERRRVRPAFRRYLDVLAEFTLRGGKRFRALLFLAGYWIATGKSPTPALPGAVALEQFQSWMLIHDDIIDHAEERRGGPTVHRWFEREHHGRGGLGDAESFGVGIGITLGDLEEPFTVAGLLDASGPAERRLALLEEYARMTRETAYGQLLDVELGSRPVGDVSESDILLVHRLKSAFYTVASPLRMGATLGGGSTALLGDLEAVGLDVGVAFQLRDDVLGAGLGSTDVGKSANDLTEGKRTLLVVRAWHGTDSHGRGKLERVLGNPDASREAIEAARAVIRDSGSLQYSERQIEGLLRRAKGRIKRSRSLRPDARKLLFEIGDRLTNRSI